MVPKSESDAVVQHMKNDTVTRSPPSSTSDVEKRQYNGHESSSPASFAEEDNVVTLKTWIVVAILASAYGVSFFIVPAVSAVGTQIATRLGTPEDSTWFVSIYTMCVAIAFMICGANSDLFGRRWFIIMGNVLMFIGYIIAGSAKTTHHVIIGFAFIGFGAGNAQLAAFALPELLPNKWRHIGVIIADLGTWVAVLVGPIAARYAIRRGDAWRWLFYGPAIGCVLSFIGLYLLYKPPAHPRGLSFRQALRELDYSGAIMFTTGATLILTGIVYSTFLPSTSPKVIATLVSGFGVMTLFGLYETFAPLKQPLTPTHVFTRSKGRELTAPFIVGFVVTMFYYAVNIIYPTQIATLWTDETTTLKYSILLTLPQNIGLIFGEILLWLFGIRIGHWKWTLTGSVAMMVIFGALLSLGTPDNRSMMMAFVFLSQTGFGWAQMLSITYIQFGVPQIELGISGGLAGVSRFAGGAIAVSVYTTILSNTQAKRALALIPKAVVAAGLPASSVAAFMSALPLGSTALAKVPGITTNVIIAGGKAFQQSYVHATSVTALASLSFGIVGIIACCFCLDIGQKMNNKIEIYLENTENADKNEFH